MGGWDERIKKKINLAMRAKQGWWLIKEVNPLVSQLMKAKYYTDTDLLNADIRKYPSYVWHGIMTALDEVKTGVRR